MKAETTTELSKYTLPNLEGKVSSDTVIKLINVTEKLTVDSTGVVKVTESKVVQDGLPPNSIRTTPNECITF